MPSLTFSRKTQFELLDNGVYKIDDPKFSEVAAVNRDGTYYVASESTALDADFRRKVASWTRAGLLPSFERSKAKVVGLEVIKQLLGSEYDILTQRAGVEGAPVKLGMALEAAARAKASDLKFIESAARTVVRLKVSGREFTAPMTLTRHEGASSMAALFDARDDGTGEATAMATKFQSFSISPGRKLRLPTGVVKLRGQRGYHELDSGLGEHMVLRLFYSEAAQKATASLEALGFDFEVTQALSRARARLAGGIIIAGATGDGKSTTLIRCLQRLYEEHEERISIVTIEDPVEYRIAGDGIKQIPVRSGGTPEERTMAFRQALMHFVRINPDVGSISEIRDAEAAKEVVQFVDTGHQVWTTIHGRSANGILFRLIEMGIKAEELCKPGTIEILMKQSLAPKLCAGCALPLGASRDERVPEIRGQLEALDIDTGQVRVRNSEGCTRCQRNSRDPVILAAWSGYERQVAVAEVIIPDKNYLEAVRRHDAFGAEERWLAPVDAGGLAGTPLDAKLAGMTRDGTLDPFDAIRKGCDFAGIDPRLLPGSTRRAPIPLTVVGRR